MRLIGDDNSIGPLVTLQTSGTVTGAIGVAHANGNVLAAWPTSGPSDTRYGSFRLDGTALADASLGMPAISDVQSGANELIVETLTSGTVQVSTIDAAGAQSTPLTATANASIPGHAVRNSLGYGVLWTSSGSMLHLTGLFSMGAIYLPDRALGSAAGTLFVWTGTRHVLVWGSASGAPQLEFLDENLQVTSGPFEVLGPSTYSANQSFAWNGTELGVFRTQSSPYDLAFTPTDETGTALTAEMQLGPGTPMQLNGPYEAGGPNRFAVVWSVGSNPAEVRFAVVCR